MQANWLKKFLCGFVIDRPFCSSAFFQNKFSQKIALQYDKFAEITILLPFSFASED